jgi:peptide methionine sulfoxide reductase MsrB
MYLQLVVVLGLQDGAPEKPKHNRPKSAKAQMVLACYVCHRQLFDRHYFQQHCSVSSFFSKAAWFFKVVHQQESACF